MTMPRALIAAGGTGGHVFPGLAVARELQHAGWQVDWVGTDRGLEARVVPEAGIGLHLLKFSGLRGKGLTAWLTLPLRLIRAARDAGDILQRTHPQVVVSFGGYVTFPIGLMARWRHIPLCIHEQNAVMGTANRWLAKFAQKVLLTFPGTQRVPSLASVVGNPVRQSIESMPSPEERLGGRDHELRILVIGGSLGASALNNALPSLFHQAKGRGVLLSVRHQTGPNDLDQVTKKYAELGLSAECLAFIDDMRAAYEWSDLIICRAGASTVTEVAAAGLAAVFVPLPSAIDDHQTANARHLADQQAAWLVPQSALASDALVNLLMDLRREEIQQVAKRARALSIPNAAQAVASEAVMLSGGVLMKTEAITSEHQP